MSRARRSRAQSNSGGRRSASASSTLIWIDGIGAGAAERCAGDHERVGRLRRADGRRARAAADERDLAEEVARAERVDLAARAGHVGRALDDDDELACRSRPPSSACSPRGRSTSSAIAAISRSSRFEQSAKSGTPAISSIFASLREHQAILRRAVARVKRRGIQCCHGQRYRRTHRRRRSQPDRQEERHALAHPRRRALRPGRERPRSRGTTSIPAEIEDLQWGCVTQVDEQAWNIGRNVALTAGWPVSVCGTTVDRQCGSSMQTNFNAAAAVWSGQLDLVISGGVEMMSRVPMGSNNGSMSDARHRALRHRDAGHLGRGDREAVEPLARGARPVLATSRMRARARAIDEGRFEKEIIPIDARRAGPDDDGGGTRR